MYIHLHIHTDILDISQYILRLYSNHIEIPIHCYV